MKWWQFVMITIISGFAGILICQLILPAFVSNIKPTLDSLNSLDATNIISWSAILLTLTGLIFTIILLSKEYHPKPLFVGLAISFLFSTLLLCAGSFLYLYLETPSIFNNTTLWIRILKTLSYPSLVSIYLGSPQPIWIISTVLFLTIFNSVFYSLGGF